MGAGSWSTVIVFSDSASHEFFREQEPVVAKD
jgi:hypothetical protein